MYNGIMNMKASMNADVPYKARHLHTPCMQSQVLMIHIPRKGPANNALVTSSFTSRMQQSEYSHSRHLPPLLKHALTCIERYKYIFSAFSRGFIH